MQTWFPFHIRERIADITEKYPNGFIRTGIRPSMYARTSEMERDIAELELKKYKTCRRAVPKVMCALGLKSNGARETPTFLGEAMQLLREAKVENRTAMKKVSRKMGKVRGTLMSSLMRSKSSKALSVPSEVLLEHDDQSFDSTDVGNGRKRTDDMRGSKNRCRNHNAPT